MKLDFETVKSAVSVIPEIAACYLFGSAAKGESIVNDIDLLILVYPYADAEKVLWTVVEKVSDVVNLQADVLDILLFDLSIANPHVLYAAINDGILIKNESSDLLADRIEALSRYFLDNEQIIQNAGRLNLEMILEVCCDG